MYKSTILVSLIFTWIIYQVQAESCKGQEVKYRPHDSLCSKFWQCGQGEWHLMDCPPGLEFSPITWNCQIPSIAKCELTTPKPIPTTTQTTTTTKPTTTTQKPTTTTQKPTTTTQKPTTTTQKPTTTTQKPTTTTQKPTTTTQKPTTQKPTTTTQKPTTTTQKPTTTTKKPTTQTPKPTTTTTQKPTTTQQPLNVCPPGPVDITLPPILLPVQNCSQFIICDNFGVGHLMDCAPSNPRLIFDVTIQQCQHSWLADHIVCDRS